MFFVLVLWSRFGIYGTTSCLLVYVFLRGFFPFSGLMVIGLAAFNYIADNGFTYLFIHLKINQSTCNQAERKRYRYKQAACSGGDKG